MVINDKLNWAMLKIANEIRFRFQKYILRVKRNYGTHFFIFRNKLNILNILASNNYTLQIKNIWVLLTLKQCLERKN